MSVVNSRQYHMLMCNIFSIRLSNSKFSILWLREQKKKIYGSPLEYWTDEQHTKERWRRMPSQSERRASKGTRGMRNKKRRLPAKKLCWWCFPSFFHRQYYRCYSTMLNAFWQIEWFSLALSLFVIMLWTALHTYIQIYIQTCTSKSITSISLFIYC